jgi:hypothetical protein
MKELIRGSISNYLKFKHDSIKEIIIQLELELGKLEPNVNVYFLLLLETLQKGLHNCNSYSEVEEIIQKYINNSKEYIFNKKEFNQFEKIIQKILPEFKYLIEEPNEIEIILHEHKKQIPNVRKKEFKSIYDLFKEYLHKEIPIGAYKLIPDKFIEIYTSDEKKGPFKAWYNNYSNHEDSEEIKEVEENFQENLNRILKEIYEEHNKK